MSGEIYTNIKYGVSGKGVHITGLHRETHLLRSAQLVMCRFDFMLYVRLCIYCYRKGDAHEQV